MTLVCQSYVIRNIFINPVCGCGVKIFVFVFGPFSIFVATLLYMLCCKGFVLGIPKMYWPGYAKIQDDEETPIKLRVSNTSKFEGISLNLGVCTNYLLYIKRKSAPSIMA